MPGRAGASLDLMPEGPTLRPGWRWHRAGLPASRRRPKDDPWVARARAFRKALDRAGGSTTDHRLAALDPPVLGGFLLARGEQRCRWEVEARLLAGQDDAAIAAKVGSDPRAIEAYESLFYAVRDRLAATDWIAFVAIGPPPHLGFDVDDTEILWKALAYQGGPLVLDAVIASPPDGSGDGAADPRLAAQFRLLVATRTLVVTPDNALDVIGLYQEHLRLEREAAAAGASAVTQPVLVTLDVEIGPGLSKVGRAGCSPEGVDPADPGAGGGQVGALDGAEDRCRSTA